MLQFVLPEFAAIYQTFNTPLPALTPVDYYHRTLQQPTGMAGGSTLPGSGLGTSF